MAEVDTKSEGSSLGVKVRFSAAAEEVYFVLRPGMTPGLRPDPNTVARPESINVFKSFRRFSMLFKSGLFIFKCKILLFFEVN